SPSHPYTEATLYLKESRNWESSIHILWEKGLEIEPTLAKLKTVEGISDVYTLNEILKDIIPQNYPEPIKDLIKRDASTLSFFSQFSDSKNLAALLYLNSYDLSFLKRTIKEIKEICNEECKVVGEPVIYEEFTTETVSYLKKALIFCFLLIGLVLGIISFVKTKSLLVVPKVIVSSFWGPITLLGLIGLFNVPLQMTNIMILTVLIGLTGDNQIHYLVGQKSPTELLKEKGIGSFLMLIFMFLGGLLFLFMDFNPMKTLGLIFALGVTLSFIGDYFLFHFFLDANSQ
ncbi:MAG: hypothetical protein NXH75_03550, partial [Halobacteriovoraceae bacterium]|nr:hypothetical protein [Halobacteriovoraceae bacterium]